MAKHNLKLVQRESEPGTRERGKALIVVGFKCAVVVLWQGTFYIGEHIMESCGHADPHEPFRLPECWLDASKLDDGIYICDLTFAECGVSDWDGGPEFDLSAQNVRKATEDEWKEYYEGEWPWEPILEEEG